MTLRLTASRDSHSRSLMQLRHAGLLVAAFACALMPQRHARPVEPATLVVTNGKVVTVDDGEAEAQAVAVAGDRIVAVGSEDEIKRYVGTRTQVIDAGGQLVIPGFIEEPRPLHRRRRGAARAQAGDGADVGRHPGDGRERRQVREARPVDLRPRLASGEVDDAAVAERRGVSDRSVAQPACRRPIPCC